MEHKEVQKKGPRMSVPQFGEWAHKDGASDVSSGYTVVFTRARADRQHQKNDLTDVKRQSQLEDHHNHHQDNNQTIPSKHKPPHHNHSQYHHLNKKHDRLSNKPEDEEASASAITPVPLMGKKTNKVKSWFFCCFRP